MSNKLLLIAAAGAALALPVLAAAAGKPKLKETVKFAQSWEAAIEEARLLNVPLVVHSHGFY
jgi:hypothetical protein